MENNSLISIKDLRVSFAQGNQPIEAVKGISLDIEKGKTVAIVGESGSGKSVTALSILKLLPYPKAFHPSGEIIYQGQNILQCSEKSMRAIRGDKISMIFQEPMTSFNPLHTIEKQISETLLLHKGLTGAKARARVIELLTLVGIPSPETRLSSYPHQLSGGQKQRVMIAMALANEPELLIADEPTTALDVTVQKQVLELLRDLQAKLGMAILLITHDLNIVKHYSDQVVVMHLGKVVEKADTATLFNAPQHHYTQTLIDADPTGSPTPISAEAPTLLKTQDLNIWFPIKKNFFGKTTSYFKAANNISISVAKGETLGIVGESGSGKTTLGLSLVKLLQSHGEIHFKDHPIHNYNQQAFRPLRRQIQIVFQDPYGSLSPRMSVQQIIEEGLVIHELGSEQEREAKVIQALKDVELDPESRHRYPHEFSGGQRQRIAIARALVLQPELIILDEPTSALDRTVQSQVVNLLRNIQQKYQISYLFISHDLAVVKALSHRVMVMKQGEVVEYGDSHQIFDSPKEAYTQTLIEASFYSTLEAAS
ncbi:ABC transporter ATP-binding protein [Alkalimarinus sediminis]|uniref:ABC transporter ATP-binding protein n=1 Tax=Alkalimarinus sediminis TaxID=1632866 RepID=A0A9E8HKM7_9ALTE|nr:ABC transporter ATP-binding protein [Alkalimarinus sediminis]UZW76075.1 ABC transporter ATP-binding protein [Alkalimarinus sediminis]